MGSQVLRVATRVWTESWPVSIARPARFRVDHWIVAFWVLLGVMGFYYVAGTNASSLPVTAIDGGVVPPRAD